MRTLRKENGGYALLYVLVVVILLGAVALSICAIALRNYQAQVTSAAQMQDLYRAEGEIEKFVALADGIVLEGDCTGEAYENAIQAKLPGPDITWEVKEDMSQITLSAQGGTAKVTAVLKVEPNVIQEEARDSETGNVETPKLTEMKLTGYISYEITHLEPEAEGGE